MTATNDEGTTAAGGEPEEAFDATALEGVRCPLCGSAGTLRPIRVGRRLRVGILSFVLSAGKDFECSRCTAAFSTERLLRERGQPDDDEAARPPIRPRPPAGVSRPVRIPV